mmetsp:Transcript_104887/g.224133  ORF Transcript_104887/g.224133 Transcript_104887/m.224133 type:complete len:158 (-) Transcript_104887:87-560(-)|eukprot:CAMPEP_0180603574 /NCGR_PEP_ID=MMETSP1037_2-20121125/25581_1 /TAXON_ID=632150 /ORGANISM="Azadinium spinosum, Strain 3D9" /LENGTH=157 /DNA_ID=CAMNT_0022622479 /DNA_START=63 /DNA_END=536 /DNA_ORIENTATION=-
MAAEELESALAASKERIMKHMNDDHGDSLLAYARHYAKMDTATSSQITDLSAAGLTLEVALDGGRSDQAFVPFSRPLTNAGDIRKIVVEMHHEAYGALGCVFKLQQGYYSSMVRHALEGMQKSKTAMIAVAVVGIAAVGTGLFAVSRRRRLSDSAAK